MEKKWNMFDLIVIYLNGWGIIDLIVYNELMKVTSIMKV